MDHEIQRANFSKLRLLRVDVQSNRNKMSQPGYLSSVPSSSSALQTESEKDQVKYKGVRKRKWGKWVSEIRFPNSRERIWLGSYDSAEKAARAFDAAQSCLRGKNAKFNFPHDPPDLSGGRSLTPAEIQAIASQYANNYNPEEQQLQQPQGDELVISEKDDDLQSQMMELEDISPLSSNSDGASQMDNMNWSFFDMLEPYGIDSNFPDYGLMLSSFDSMHVAMNTSPHLGTNVGDNSNGLHGDEQNADEHYGHEFFLWNF